jgi:hypothetical protein
MKRLAAIALALLATGCANWDGYAASMSSRYKGQHVDRVVRDLGVPTGKANLSDGGQVIEFVTYFNGYRCEDQFTTDARGIVISSRHGGQNGCAIGR